MKSKVLLTAMLVLSVLLSSSSAQVSNVDWDLEEVYEHFAGVSLAEAVLYKLYPQRAATVGGGNVYVQFNGGGIDNRLYSGRKNTLEILVTNDAPLGGLSLGFEFTCTAGSGSFSWVEGYGDADSLGIVKLHNEVVPPWTTFVTTTQAPNSILIGGADFSAVNPLPVHNLLTLLYSMQIEIPAGTPDKVNGFSVDNIFFPPAGDWIFTDASGGYAPNFQGNPNTSGGNPDAPPVCFDIVEKTCYPSGSRTKGFTVKIPRPDRPRVVADYDNHPAVRKDGDGNVILMVYIDFEGNDADLEALGLNLGPFKLGGNTIATEFPLSLLPKVCMVKGVKRILSPGRLEIKLNYSTQDIDGHYVTTQQQHVTGEGAIIGIVDGGVDWLPTVSYNGTLSTCRWAGKE
ncbi:MAG: hypothetical protein KAT58_04290 [candidate division Zixibacteria bacterium]|nr:hypothetical protein [candidate division Zixibacteria bacterium]